MLLPQTPFLPVVLRSPSNSPTATEYPKNQLTTHEAGGTEGSLAKRGVLQEAARPGCPGGRRPLTSVAVEVLGVAVVGGEALGEHVPQEFSGPVIRKDVVN